MLVSSFVLSRLDYCNALLAGSPRVILDKIQRVINGSTRLIFRVPKSANVILILYDLHWLPISSRIQYKNSSHLLPNRFWYSPSMLL